MEVLYPRCAGMDVHNDVVVARVPLNSQGQASLTGFFSVVGDYLIRAIYSGDSSFAASSQSLTEQVI